MARGYGFGYGYTKNSLLGSVVTYLATLENNAISTASPVDTVVARYAVINLPDGVTIDTASLIDDGNGAFAIALVGDEIHVTLADPSKAVCPPFWLAADGDNFLAADADNYFEVA